MLTHALQQRGKFRVYNVQIALKLGLEAAALLCELAGVLDTLRATLKEDDEGKIWFYRTVEDVESRTGLSRWQQETAIRRLKEAGLLESRRRGLPAKRHFWLDEMSIIAYLAAADATVNSVEKPLSCGGTHHIQIEEKPPTLPMESLDNCSGNAADNIRAKERKRERNKNLKYENIASGDATTTSSSTASLAASQKPKRCGKESPSRGDRPTGGEERREIAAGVWLSTQEEERLRAKYGSKELFQEGLELLSLWKESADPKQVRKHSSDYYRLHRWVYDRVMEGHRGRGTAPLTDEEIRLAQARHRLKRDPNSFVGAQPASQPAEKPKIKSYSKEELEEGDYYLKTVFGINLDVGA